MISVISNAFFINFHTIGSGAVFNASNLTINIYNSAFHCCTSNTSAACFLFTSSTVNVTKSCFYHSQVNYHKNDVFGNAFLISYSDPANFEYISAYECGYDEKTVADTTFATVNTSIIAKNVNSSHCTSFGGPVSFGTSKPPIENYMEFVTCAHTFGEVSYIHTVISGTSKVNYINSIHNNVTSIFWLHKNDIMNVNNGVFYDNTYKEFVNTDRENTLIINNCFSDDLINDLPSLSHTDSFELFIDTIIPAEICELNSFNQKTCKISNESSLITSIFIYTILTSHINHNKFESG